MRNQHHRPGCAFQDPRDIPWSLRPESDAGEVERFTTRADGGAGIVQHRESVRDQRCRHVPIVVMITEDGVHAHRRREPRQPFRTWNDVTPIEVRDVISPEHDQIRPLVHHHGRRTLHVLQGHHLAVMKIGNQSDAKSIERWRKPGHAGNAARTICS